MHALKVINKDMPTQKNNGLNILQLLGEETNMKEIGSLKGLEKFLKTCNKQARAQYLGLVFVNAST